MFGFPIGNGDAGMTGFLEKFTNNADSGFPKIQQREVFYSIKNGNWEDTTVWQTASGRVGKLPTDNDDVYIRNVVTINGLGIRYCYNLFISKNATLTTSPDANEIYVYGNIKSYGIINFNISTVGHGLWLFGEDNYIENMLFNSSSSVTYARFGNQRVLEDLPYPNIYLRNGGTKYITKNFVVNGNLYTREFTNFELGFYDLTVTGQANLNGFITKSHFGNVVVGSFAAGAVSSLMFDFSGGNPNVEVKNGIALSRSNFNTGTGQWKFTTNNQTINDGSGGWPYASGWFAPILIDNNIELTIGANMQSLTLTNIVDGSNSLSKLINRGILNFATQNAAENSMVTGIFDITTNVNTVGYQGNYSATIPSRFPTFHNLTISGTGTKTLGVNTTLNGNLTIPGSTTGLTALELDAYNFTVNGTTTFTGGSVTFRPTISKSGAGNVVFGGLISSSYTNNIKIDFSVGNPTVEIKGGFNIGVAGNNPSVLSGTGLWSVTQNQSWKIADGGGSGGINNSSFKNVYVSPGVTLTNDIPTANAAGIIVFENQIEVGAGGQFINKTIARFYSTTTLIGSFDFLTFPNVVSYYVDGNFTLPMSSFYSLQLAHKINAIYTVTAPATLSLLGNFETTSPFSGLTYTFDISAVTNFIVPGTCNLGKGGLLKTTSGSVVFGGDFRSGYSGGGNVVFSGNPTVEFKGGISEIGGGRNFGNGNMTFSTNNQSIKTIGDTTFENNVTISGAITLTINSTQWIFNGQLNGNNASSKLLMAANTGLTYRNATQPMVTGILDTSTNLNTWVYGLNNQDIKGGPTTLAKQVYRNLTLNGTGVKTLQGYVSVLNTYTLTAPATLALNGFTLTNP